MAASTVWNILNQAGIDPAPRPTGLTWRPFLAAQDEHIVAVDFLHVDTINLNESMPWSCSNTAAAARTCSASPPTPPPMDHPGRPQLLHGHRYAHRGHQVPDP
jgi:hypothetical protein